jgi:hypothetical protein
VQRNTGNGQHGETASALPDTSLVMVSMGFQWVPRDTLQRAFTTRRTVGRTLPALVALWGTHVGDRFDFSRQKVVESRQPSAMFPVRRKRVEDSHSRPKTRMKSGAGQESSSGEEYWDGDDSQGFQAESHDGFIDFSKCIIIPIQKQRIYRVSVQWEESESCLLACFHCNHGLLQGGPCCHACKNCLQLTFCNFLFRSL